MALTPLDIRKQEFKKVMRGCDPIEVETFLETVSEEFANTKAENEDLKQKLMHFTDEVERLESELKKARELEKESKIPEKEAEIIIKQAEIKAMEILEKSKSESNRIREEIFVLKSQKSSFVKRLKHLFSAQLEFIEVLEVEDEDIDNLKELNKQLTKKKYNSAAKNNTEEEKSERLNELLSNLELRENREGSNFDKDLPFIRQKAKELLNSNLEKQKEKKDDIGKLIDELGD
jgi:cell division initiation protein